MQSPHVDSSLLRFTQSGNAYPYWYAASVDPDASGAVYDGDTIRWVDIDLGFHIKTQLKSVRLFGIDAPEIRGAERIEGLITRDWLREQIADAGHKFKLKSYRDQTGKYGRWLAEIFVGDRNLNLEMVKLGLADLNFYD